MARAWRTASLVAAEHGIHPEVDGALSERFYVSLWDTPIEGAFNWDWDPDGCEPLATFVHRAAQSVMRILADDTPDGETVIVAHGGILLVTCALTRATLENGHIAATRFRCALTRQNGAWLARALPPGDSDIVAPMRPTRPDRTSPALRRERAGVRQRRRSPRRCARSTFRISRSIPARAIAACTTARQLSRQRAPQMLLCLHEESAVAIAHGYAKVTGTRDGGGGAFQCRPDARHHGDLQCLVRPHAGAGARRDRPGRCRQAPAVDRLDPHRARPGRAGAPLHQMGRPAGLARGGARSAAARHAGSPTRRRKGRSMSNLDAEMQEAKLAEPLPPSTPRASCRRSRARRAAERSAQAAALLKAAKNIVMLIGRARAAKAHGTRASRSPKRSARASSPT